jgi:hypothetical protein
MKPLKIKITGMREIKGITSKKYTEKMEQRFHVLRFFNPLNPLHPG